MSHQSVQNCSIAKNNVVRSSNDRDVVMSNVNVDSSNVRSINDQNNVADIFTLLHKLIFVDSS